MTLPDLLDNLTKPRYRFQMSVARRFLSFVTC